MNKATEQITNILRACGCDPQASGNKIKVNAPTLKGGKQNGNT